MIIIITIRSAHIGFEEAGIDDDTSVKNMAYDVIGDQISTQLIVRRKS
jgi:hypothetical protein